MHGLLKCRSVRRKPPGEQRSRRETVEARGTKWNFDVEMDSGVSGPPVTSRPDEQVPSDGTDVPPLAEKNTYLKFEVTATAEEAMWRPRRRFARNSICITFVPCLVIRVDPRSRSASSQCVR